MALLTVEQWLDNVIETCLELASGMLVLQKAFSSAVILKEQGCK